MSCSFLILFLFTQKCYSQKDSSDFLNKNTFRVLVGGFGSKSTYEKGFCASFNYERVLANRLTLNNLASLVLFRGRKQNRHETETSFNLNISSELRYYFLLKRNQMQDRPYANMRAFYTGINFYALSNRIAKFYTEKENWHMGQAGMHIRVGWQKQFDRAFINLYGGAHIGLKKFVRTPTETDEFENLNYGFRVGYLF